MAGKYRNIKNKIKISTRGGKRMTDATVSLGKKEVLLETGGYNNVLLETGDKLLLEG